LSIALRAFRCPSSEVAQLTFENSPSAITAFAKNRFAKSHAATGAGILANDVLKQLVPQLNRIQMPAGYTINGGRGGKRGRYVRGGIYDHRHRNPVPVRSSLILQFKTFKALLIVLSVIRWA